MACPTPTLLRALPVPPRSARALRGPLNIWRIRFQKLYIRIRDYKGEEGGGPDTEPVTPRHRNSGRGAPCPRAPPALLPARDRRWRSMRSIARVNLRVVILEEDDRGLARSFGSSRDGGSSLQKWILHSLFLPLSLSLSLWLWRMMSLRRFFSSLTQRFT